MASEASLEAVAGQLRRIDPELRVLWVGAGPGGRPGEQAVTDDSGTLRAAYGADAGALYLVRPDRHVAARWKAPEPTRVLASMRRALGETDQ